MKPELPPPSPELKKPELAKPVTRDNDAWDIPAFLRRSRLK